MTSQEEKNVEEASRALDTLQRAEVEFNRAVDTVRKDLERRVAALIGAERTIVKRVSFMTHGVVSVVERFQDRKYSFNSEPDDDEIAFRPAQAGHFSIDSIPFMISKKKELAEIGRIADRAGLFTDASELTVTIPEEPEADDNEEEEAATDDPVFEVTLDGDNDQGQLKKVKLSVE